MSLSTVEFLMLSDPEEMDNVFFFFLGNKPETQEMAVPKEWICIQQMVVPKECNIGRH